MARWKFLVIYIWTELVISCIWTVSAKPLTHRSNTDEHGTNVDYDLQKMDDDSLLTTDVRLKQNKGHLERPDNGKTSHDKTINSERNRHNLHSRFSTETEKQKINTGHNKEYRPRRFQQRQRGSWKSNWMSKVDKMTDNSKKVINRESRNQDTNDDDDDGEDHIQSKDEEEDDDVQLIIIPRKPHKRPRPKIKDDDSDRETEQLVLKEPKDRRENSENSRNSQDSENSRYTSENPQYDSENSEYHSRHPKKFRDGDTLSLERVATDDDDNNDSDEDDKSNDQSSEKVGDYDLHVKVKDKSGTNLKLTGDLPRNIAKLVAEGEGGGRVQLKNSKSKDIPKVTPEELQGGNDDTTTDEVAQNLIKMKSGKLKHAPYPSTVLLKPSESVSSRGKDSLANTGDDGTIASEESREMEQEVSLLKSKGRDKYSSQEVAKTVLKPASQVPSSEGNEQTNKQPDNNVFSPMEFENGDDEMVATSRLLDIARKADDESSLKEIKDSSNTIKDPKSSSPSSLTGKQRSTTFSKSSKLAPEDYKKESDEIDKEADDNWYKMQSLEDRIVDEGSSAKTGKEVGSYNGQEVSVVSPSQLQLLQTEYPSYPAYLTPLQRTKVKNE